MLNYWIIFIPFTIVCLLFAKGAILVASNGKQTKSKKTLKYSILACVVSAWHLAGAILVFITIFGGLTRWGKIEGSKYYLGHGTHFTEVSQNIYWLCYYYVAIAEVMLAVAIIAATASFFWNRKSKSKLKNSQSTTT